MRVNRPRRGFSYIEIMVALMIISAGIMPLYILFTGSQKQTAVARNTLMATYLGRSLLDEQRFVPFVRHKPETSEDFKKVEGPAMNLAWMAPISEAPAMIWPKFYELFKYNLKKIPITDSITREILGYKLQLTLRWSELGRDKELKFGAIAARMEK